MMKLSVNQKSQRVGILLTVEHVKSRVQIDTQLGDTTNLTISRDISFTTAASVCRYIARAVPDAKLYGSTLLEKAEVDHWLEFGTVTLLCAADFKDALEYLDKVIGQITFLVGQTISLADFVVWGALRESAEFSNLLALKRAPTNVTRYFKALAGHKDFVKVTGMLPKVDSAADEPSQGGLSERKAEGKFAELPGAEDGKVVVRFPPEASGYLHIGHAKAALLNQYYQQRFNGKLIMRFDDTNPQKENAEFEKVILDDLALLGVKPDVFTFTSNHFDLLIDLCTRMIREGKAYVDDTEPETMKKEREERTESKNRSNSVEINLSKWEEMKKGSPAGQKCCVRAKLDMQSDNGCLRDPTMYRCKVESHVKTGDKYKTYPTYDFACPIVDSVEGVTHALRTMEYHDRDDQYFWFLRALGLREPYLWEYSRLNLQNTVMSKRKLTWFVESGLVDGWDDPRFPTVRGVMRRGMTVEGLKEFVIAQGSSRSINMMDWDKIWAFNKKVIDPVVPRFTALKKDDLVPVHVVGAMEEVKEIQKHPKDASIGTKATWYGSKVFIEGADASEFTLGENVTFINWGNLVINKIDKSPAGKVTAIEASLNLDNKDFKKTQKITWLTETSKAPFTPTVCVNFDHIISKAVLGKDDDFKQFINKDSRAEIEMLGDPELAKLKKGDMVQLQRRGYYICDVPCEPASRYSGREQACVLFNIPDGHTKDMPTAGSKHKAKDSTPSAKEQAQTQRGKSAEKCPQVEVALAIEDEEESDPQVISLVINVLGHKIRQLKADKADKATVEKEVKALLQLKEVYKATTGQAWKPDTAVPAAKPVAATAMNDPLIDKVKQFIAGKADKPTSEEAEVEDLLKLWTSPKFMNQSIIDQGNKIKQLKADKADKPTLDKEVKALLQLKEDYKAATGQAWKPDTAVPAAKQVAAAISTAAQAPTGSLLSTPQSINQAINDQGNKIRQLKADKVDKAVLDKEVKALLLLKEDYKSATGQAWKPDSTPAAVAAAKPAAAEVAVSQASTAAVAPPTPADSLASGIDAQGLKVCDLKSNKASKADIDTQVKILLSLKAAYKNSTGHDYVPSQAGAAPPQPAKSSDKKQEQGGKKQEQGGKKLEQGKKEKVKGEASEVASADQPADSDAAREVKKVTRLGMEVRKDENFSEWYSQVITKSEMIEYYNVSGCYVLRPWAFGIWESIQKWFDAEIKKIGFENCYFPMFVSESALETEKEHVEDFAPEVAWVTRSGNTQLAEPIAIRPTSETVMYPSYAKWVQSHRDLPIKLNQWCNVVRWEFKHPQPFLRTREFLWQEGHSAYATYAEAEKEVYYIIDLYEKIYENLLAIPVIKGKKTQKEKFAGGDYTTTVEAFIAATGRGIQAATSHHLGQNFSKMFKISFDDPDTGDRRFAYQNSWAITTRSIGIIVMVHGDDKGLVLPPNIAQVQVIVVPCGVTAQLPEADKKQLSDKCEELVKLLQSREIRVRGDYRDNYSPGWKFNHWELKGVPIRIEIGPRDVQKAEFVAVRRDTGDKVTLKLSDAVKAVTKMLDDVQTSMFTKAKKELDSHVVLVADFDKFCTELDKSNVILAPFCGGIKCEEQIKKLSARDAVQEDGAPAMGAKGLCIPFKQPKDIKAEDKCICPACPEKPQYYTLFGRSY